MPELPEVETVKETLKRQILKEKINIYLIILHFFGIIYLA